MENVLEKLGDTIRDDAKEFLRRVVVRDTPFAALTVCEMGDMVPTRHGRRRDRELVRKKIARPLVELGCLEKVTRTKFGKLLIGHPISKSPHCAYRLTRSFWDMVFGQRSSSPNATFQRCVDVNDIKKGNFSSCSCSSLHEELMDACIHYFFPLHISESCILYRDPSNGPRVGISELMSLSVVNLEMNVLHDPCPDLIFWNEETNTLWILEAVTTEGIIDTPRKQRLEKWVRRGNADVLIQYVTAFVTWKVAASFMSNISPNTYVWVQESPFTLWTSCSK